MAMDPADDEAWTGNGLSQDIAKQRLAQQQGQADQAITAGDRFGSAYHQGGAGAASGAAAGGWIGAIAGGAIGAVKGALSAKHGDSIQNAGDVFVPSQLSDAVTQKGVDKLNQPAAKQSPGLNGTVQPSSAQILAPGDFETDDMGRAIGAGSNVA